MTKEELKEAISATITENGQKGITGQALANLLNEIVDAAGSGGGSGGGTLALLAEMDTSEAKFFSNPNETNALLYQKLITGLDSCMAYSVSIFFAVDMSAYGAGVVKMVVQAIDYSYSFDGLMVNFGDYGSYLLSEDGSMTVVQEGI